MNTQNTENVTLHAYASEDAVFHGGDPHAVTIDLDPADVARYDATLGGRPPVGIGRYVEVTDQRTGARYRVASAPCGAGCHCAAIALPVPPEDLTPTAARVYSEQRADGMDDEFSLEAALVTQDAEIAIENGEEI